MIGNCFTRQRNTGKRGVPTFGSSEVPKAQDRHVLGNAQAESDSCLANTQTKPVISTSDRSRSGKPSQERLESFCRLTLQRHPSGQRIVFRIPESKELEGLHREAPPPRQIAKTAGAILDQRHPVDEELKM